MDSALTTPDRRRVQRTIAGTGAVSIVGHVERLGPSYDSGWVHFSLNLTAALDPGSGTITVDDVRTFLSPWTWTWASLAVLGVDAANKTVTLPAGSVEVLIDQVPPTPAALTTALVSEREAVIAGDASLVPFVTRVAQPVERATVAESKPDGKPVSKRHWKSFLSQTSTLPVPLPQSAGLKLCVSFRIQEAQLKDVVDVVAAPVFTGAPFGGRGPQLPSTPWDVTQNNPLRRVPASGMSPERYEWDYESLSGEPSIIAGLNRCPVVLPPGTSGSLLDFETLWVKDSKSVLPEDWTVRLEAVLADAFDVPRRLLDALQMNVQRLRGSGALAWTVDQPFHDAFIASLRDLANYGLASPPEQKTLAATLIGDLPGGLTALARLEAHETRYKDPAVWRTRVIEFVNDVEPIEPFPAITAGMDVAAYARALEQVYTVFATDANAVRFFIAEWDAALGGTTFWTSERRAQVIERIGGLQLRKRMATGNVGVAWRRLAGNLHLPKELVAAVQRGFHDYVRGRFATTPALGYDRYLPPGSGPPVQVIPHLDTYAASFVEEAILPRDRDGSDPGSVREDLIIQVDRLQRIGDDGSVEDNDDYLRRIAGLGVLLRRQGTTTWRCLNLAALEIHETPLGLDAVPAPLRLGYRNGLRCSYLAYSNQPMAATSPSAELSHNNQMTAEEQFVPFVGYANPYTEASTHRLEGLVYGEKYEAAVFLIGNAGNLPKELTRKDTNNRTVPWQFHSPSTEPPFTQTIPYERRVPVGQVRLFAKGTSASNTPREMDRLPVPSIPATVLPLTRSLRRPNPSTQHLDSEDTIVLLTPDDDHWVPGRNRFEFEVRPPSVPLEVWDRWVAKEPSMRDRRIRVWTRYHERADVRPEATKAAVSDLSIDDPAVAELRLTLTRIYPGATAPMSVTRQVPATAGDCSADLRCVQAPAVPVEIFSAASLQLPSGGAAPIKIGLPAGEIWRLDIQPVISDLTRFHKLTTNLGDPVTMFVEVADRLIKPSEPVSLLRQHLNKALVPKARNNDFDVTLTPTADRFWHRMHRVELLLQRWRWDGRPLSHFQDNVVRYRFPFAADPDTELERFDGALFGSRESSDHLRIPSHVDFAVPKASAAVLFTTDLSPLPGALYFRAAVRVYSRYEGLLRKDDAIDSRPPADVSGAEQWRRAVVPCRWNKAVPRPVVKLVLPLTHTIGSLAMSGDTTPLQRTGGEDDGESGIVAARAPGLLVVLDESWYSDSLGGVAEVLDWEIARVALPDLQGASRLQLGPDPLVNLDDDPLAGRAVAAHQAIGAIGYTHDTGTAAPLFTRASFVIPPPAVEGVTDLSWYFLQLRFRRRLERVPAADPADSPWTDPIWAQLLPPSNFVRVGSDLVPTTNIGFNASLGTFVNLETAAPLVPEPTQIPSGRHNFALWALTTRPVMDALGRPGQEAFVSLSPITNGAVPKPVSTDVMVRLVEIQQRATPPTNLETLLTALFPADGSDATARVVRMSPPLFTVNKE